MNPQHDLTRTFWGAKAELRSVEIYIVDFGDSVILNGDGFGRVGSVLYCAPEVTLGSYFYDQMNHAHHIG